MARAVNATQNAHKKHQQTQRKCVKKNKIKAKPANNNTKKSTVNGPEMLMKTRASDAGRRTKGLWHLLLLLFYCDQKQEMTRTTRHINAESDDGMWVWQPDCWPEGRDAVRRCGTPHYEPQCMTKCQVARLCMGHVNYKSQMRANLVN